MTRVQQLKRPIRAFFQHYTDERLAQLLAHAQDGKLSLMSCCCFIGIATANHALHGRGDLSSSISSGHYLEAKALPGAMSAELAFCHLSLVGSDQEQDAYRCRIVIPMIRAEMKRRERKLAPAQQEAVTA